MKWKSIVAAIREMHKVTNGTKEMMLQSAVVSQSIMLTPSSCFESINNKALHVAYGKSLLIDTVMPHFNTFIRPIQLPLPQKRIKLDEVS